MHISRRLTARPTAPTPPRSAWSVVQAVLAELAVVTAVLYYLGWIRAAEQYRYFGVDVGILGLSADDYVLRSPPTAIPAIVVANVLTVAGLEVYRRTELTASRRLGTALWWAAGGAAVVVGVLYVRYADWGSRLGFGLPLLLTLATGCAAAARRLRRGAPPGRVTDALTGAALLVLAGISLLWALTLYGASSGRQAARTFSAELRSRPAITVYSEKLLVLPGAAWAESYPNSHAPAYRYRYQGLRLLARTPDGYLLLPERWKRGDSVYLVQLGDGVRIDLTGS